MRIERSSPQRTRKPFRCPKAILSHPAVEACEDGDAEGFDYKYHVWLKEGFEYSNGRMAGGRTGNFQTVKDFLFAAPRQVPN
ncbi:hypothetical protein FIV00_15155 [Labrenzia sp. THAF82]|nr:hypothetical protein FIV00_15145 [Labrenzia sp. THAF82]QFT31829.1 hypothetical protein FIV00_15155 [Labrenzia sp. THAF82]